MSDTTPVEEVSERIGALTDFSDMKKKLKRIANKRSLVIASKLSGDDQDAELRKHGRALELLEADLSRCRGAQQRGNTRIEAGELKTKKSSTSHASSALRIDAVLQELEDERSHLKEQVTLSRPCPIFHTD